ALERAVSAAAERSGRALGIEGPPGIGKSSLLGAARTAAGDFRVLSARGGELEQEVPFGIVRQLLEPVLAAVQEDERRALVAGAAALAQPTLVTPVADAGEEPSFAALHGLYWLAVNLAEEQPLLVTVDDLHWADLASLRWLVYLARRL